MTRRHHSWLPIGCAALALGACAPARAQSEVEAEILTATNMVRQTSAAGTNYFLGKVGVGTASPGALLHVAGNALVQGLYFDSSDLAIGRGTNSYCRFSGYNAGVNNSGNFVVGIGYSAAHSNSASYVAAVGGGAVYSNAGAYVNGIGYMAGAYNHGSHVNGLGWRAAKYNSGSYVNGLGCQAAHSNSASYCNFIGYMAGEKNTNGYVNILGRWDAARTSVTERTYLAGDLELYDPPSSGGATSGNLLKFQGGATVQGVGTNLFLGSGRVGVGTNAPAATLHVAGTFRAEQGIVYVAPLGDVSMGCYTNGP